MTHRLRRIAFITFWSFAGFYLWPGLAYLALRFIVWGQRTYGWPPLTRWLPNGLSDVVVLGAFGLATLMTTTAALLLALRGRLPGTQKPAEPAQGFLLAAEHPASTMP